jgi:hypothetical protein
VGAEAVSSLVVVGRAWIVVEHPSCVLRAARLLPQSTDLFLCAVPEPAHPAMLLVLLPQLRVDMPLAVDWSHELIAMTRRAHGKLLGSSKFEPNTFEHVGQ